MMNNKNRRYINPINGVYEKEFWKALRKHQDFTPEEENVKISNSGAYILPAAQANSYTEELKKENFFRSFGTVIPMYENDYTVHMLATEAEPAWVEEGSEIPEDEEILGSYKFGSHKLSSIAKIHVDLLADRGFDFEAWLLKKYAQRFGKAEVNAFINGNGVNQPVGILNDNGGAEIGKTTNAGNITFDEVIELFHSVEPKLRDKAVWVMNDTTAFTLRTLKDSSGNYLWHPSSDKLLGKKVIICNAMPDITSGAKPIAFGDFSFYWITERTPFAIRRLYEKYITSSHRGYVGVEHLDGKLIRPDAVKVLEIG